MKYHFHDMWKAGLRHYFNSMAAATNINAQIIRHAAQNTALPAVTRQLARDMEASAAVMERMGRHYPKPSFNLPQTRIAGKTVAVREDIVADKPYCTLKRFARDTARNDPKILIVAPMSGHYATLLRGTVEALLPHNDVYITDWKDARDVPLKDGSFGLDDYIDYVRDMVRELGPDTHILAVCQPTVPVMAAVATLAAEKDAVKPLSMTLMGGPIDTRAAPTSVTAYADKHPIEWFRDNVTMTVPPWYKGAGQKVYPGFMQLAGFMMMNPDKHYKSHMDLFRHLRQGDGESAAKITEFYDEYLAVCDLPARFYLETVDHVFKKQSLANGTLTWRGRKVDPALITETALFTVEGALDDIAAPGQTLAAHGLLGGLDRARHFHYVQDGAGHYGIFNGRRWRDEIAPRIEAFVRKEGFEKGLVYDDIHDEKGAKKAIKIPPPWDGKTAPNHTENKQKNSNDNGLQKSGARGARLG